MNLLESYQYQNYLDSIFDQICLNLSDHQWVVRTYVSCASDDLVDKTPVRPFYDVPVDTLISLAETIIAECRDLSSAVSEAKQMTKYSTFARESVDLDAETEANKLRSRLATVLESLSLIKPTEWLKTKKLQVPNDEAKLTEEKSVIDFNRSNLLRILKNIRKSKDESYNKLTKALIETNVNFQPKFDRYDSYIDTLVNFAHTQGTTVSFK